MTQPVITGSFFDLQHVNLWDGAFWTDACRFWKVESWRALMQDMHDVGIHTAICTATALWGRPLFGGYERTVGVPLLMGCEEPLTVCVEEADRLGMELFLGVGLRGRVSQVRDYADMKPPWPDVWFAWNRALAEALVDKYGTHRSFAGLYISYEIDFLEYQVELYERLVRRFLRPVVGGVPILASPGSLGDHPDIDSLARQVERMDLNILACQDYGGRSTDVAAAIEKVRANLRGLERAIPKLESSGVRVWTNCELFSFEQSPDGRNYCVPGPFERIREQLELQAPLVEKVICYQYQGIMNRRTPLVDIGAPGCQGLYDRYVDYRRQVLPGI